MGGPPGLGLGENLTKAQTWTYLLEQHDLFQSKDKWQASVITVMNCQGTGKLCELTYLAELM